MDHFEYRPADGVTRLMCEDTDLAAIAAEVGTPTYIYSKATLTAHYERTRQAFAPLDPLICYSIKSCSNLAICRILADLGAGMDAVSGGEIERAHLAGCPMSKVVYAGVGKSEREIRAALSGEHALIESAAADRGPIGWFNVESEQEFETIAAIARDMNVRAHAALRVNPDVDPKTHRYTTTGTKETKFGVDLDRAMAFFESYGHDEFLSLDAIHIHLGSPIYTTEPYVRGIGKVLDLIDKVEAKGHKITAIDLGGGFGANYETDASPGALQYAEAIVPLLKDRADAGTRIILEPGRSIVANAGVLLMRVEYVKDGPGKKFIICDAGMHTLIRPALYEAFHFIWPAQVAPEHTPPKRGKEMELPGLEVQDVVGPICETADFLAKERKLPPVKRGDLVAVFTAGAYGMAMANNYNSHELPAEVLVEGGSFRVIRKRQDIASILAEELAV
jgi:diaminopimelate decarboxylase